MEPLLFVMAILGCGESDATCRDVRIVETRYRSEAACLAATEAELMRSDDLIFPNVVAECRRAGAQVRQLRGTDIMQPQGGRLPSTAPRYAAWFGGPARSSR